MAFQIITIELTRLPKSVNPAVTLIRSLEAYAICKRVRPHDLNPGHVILCSIRCKMWLCVIFRFYLFIINGIALN